MNFSRDYLYIVTKNIESYDYNGCAVKYSRLSGNEEFPPLPERLIFPFLGIPSEHRDSNARVQDQLMANQYLKTNSNKRPKIQIFEFKLKNCPPTRRHEPKKFGFIFSRLERGGPAFFKEKDAHYFGCDGQHLGPAC